MSAPRITLVSVRKNEDTEEILFAADCKVCSMEKYPLETLHVQKKDSDDLILATEFTPENYREADEFQRIFRFYPELYDNWTPD